MRYVPGSELARRGGLTSGKKGEEPISATDNRNATEFTGGVVNVQWKKRTEFCSPKRVVVSPRDTDRRVTRVWVVLLVLRAGG